MSIDLYGRYFDPRQKNELIIKKFQELLEAIDIQRLMADDPKEKRRHDFRHLSIRRGLSRIRGQAEPIVNAASLLQYRGIGDGIVKRIQEIINTGELAELKEIKASPRVQALLDLTTVHGLGEKLGKKLLNEFGIDSVAVLRKHLENSNPNLLGAAAAATAAPGTVARVIPHSVRVGLKYYEDIGARIPRREIAATYEMINEILFRRDPRIMSEVCGSYRRGKPTSGDIDVLFCDPGSLTEQDQILHRKELLAHLLKELSDQGRLEATLNVGYAKFQGLIRTPAPYNRVRRLDLLWVPYDSYYPSLLYFTGSDIFNRITRAIALRKGYSLTNWGLYPFTETVTRRRMEAIEVNHVTKLQDPHAPSKYVTGPKMNIRSEQELFMWLDLMWLSPDKRN